MSLRGDGGVDGRNLTSSDGVLRRASDKTQGKPGRCGNTGGKLKYDVGRPPEECQAAVAEHRKGCTEGQPESVETERQRQKGQQQRKTTARVTAKAATSLTERVQ